MPVQHIQLVARHQVDVALDGLDGQKVTSHVEHGAAPYEARAIADVHGGDRPGVATRAVQRVERRRQQLPQRLHAPDGALRCDARDARAIAAHVERVGFRVVVAQTAANGDDAGGLGTGTRPLARRMQRHAEAGLCTERLREQFPHLAPVRAFGIHHDVHRISEHERCAIGSLGDALGAAAARAAGAAVR
jgi:hypothetical protein